MQGRNVGGTITLAPNDYRGAESLRVAPNDCGEPLKVPTVSLQYICFRKSSGSNMGEPNLLLAPHARGRMIGIERPFNRNISTIKVLSAS